MVALQSQCFMWMTSRTTITNFKKARRLKRYQETKPGGTRERTSEGMPGLLWTAVCVSELDNLQCEVPELQMSIRLSWFSDVDRSFKLCESPFLGVRKLREGWSLQQAVSFEFFHSFKLTSRNAFLKTLHHQFLNRREQKRNRPLTRLFFPSPCGKKAWERD